MTVAATTADVPGAPQHEPPQETDARRTYDAWRCGLPAVAGNDQHRDCEDVIPELIVELL